MKQFLLAILVFISASTFAQTTVFQGNGKSDFGGAVGKGTLNVINTPDSFSIYLNKGTGTFDSVLVLYIDTFSTAGITSTSQLSSFGSIDKYSKATMAQGGTENPVLNFPTNFTPDFAIAFDKTGGKIYSFQFLFLSYVMIEGNTFAINAVGNSYGKGFSKSELGLTPGQTIRLNFVGTYIDGNTVSRSAEGFGDPFTGYNGTARIGSTQPYTIKSFYTYNSSTALPVVLKDFKASPLQEKVQLNWSVAQETNIEGYEVKRSGNGIQFSTIATVPARNNSGINSQYSFTDNNPLQGNNYYRLAIIEKDRKELSNILTVKTNIAAKFKIQQIGNALNVQVNNLASGMYKLLIVNPLGQTLQNSSIKIDGYLNKQIQLPTNVTKGIYRITLRSESESLTQNIFIQ
ncbi:hypothetical protein [Segetibacter aerophilus]|uniref:Secretion system C-terminal sorting domain-containing protein n=1 Tax=Segetibacter aerophilus TaxID=670293 RepID=A0A512B7D3_9BACT|nr:hypothetical protein [Segetibacter aerophilus]GEO07881.1 hypothetical protein SAE01_03770 [Segetibacter aerophilus]